MQTSIKTRRFFTQAAREAAIKARRERSVARAAFPDTLQLTMFVVRADTSHCGYRWEIRKFGELEPLLQSEEVFCDQSAARLAGDAALTAVQDEQRAGQVPAAKHAVSELSAAASG